MTDSDRTQISAWKLPARIIHRSQTFVFLVVSGPLVLMSGPGQGELEPEQDCLDPAEAVLCG